MLPWLKKLYQEHYIQLKRILLAVIILLTLIVLIWPVRVAIYAQQVTMLCKNMMYNVQSYKGAANCASGLMTNGSWSLHNYDLVYTVAFSRPEQPYGPLVVYRAPASDLSASVPVIAFPRDPQPLTPLFFPSPDGQYLALLTPLRSGYATNLNGASLSILPTTGEDLAGGDLAGATGAINRAPTFHMASANTPKCSGGPCPSQVLSNTVASGDSVIWSADSHVLYYHTGVAVVSEPKLNPLASIHETHTIVASPVRRPLVTYGYDEIHKVDLHGRDVLLLRLAQQNSSLHLIGLDRTGALILTFARPHLPVQLLRLVTNGDASTCNGKVDFPLVVQQTTAPGTSNCGLAVVATLPPDILPGNVLRVGSDGASVECERVLSWQPLRYTLIRVSFVSGSIKQVMPLFDATPFGQGVNALNRSTDGRVLVMSQVTSMRSDLAAQGLPNVPAQEQLLLADASTEARQHLVLPYGGQIVQTFWTAHVPVAQLYVVPQSVLTELLAYHKRSGGTTQNASVFQQDEWMLEGHANRLFDAPVLPKMCYGYCPQGLTGAPHVSAAILHGVAYTESNWHQFNTSDYAVNGEQVGTPVESFDGGWGEYQQTWGMPPQCIAARNCRSDVFKVEHDQSYNIGVGVQSLINAWNGSAGVVSNNDPNDPYKANDWFFAVWAYNGAYGNNPNDVPSSQYGHWYPGAPFHSIYEEYVWYFSAHPQYLSNGWTDNYLPSLGSGLLPPQSDFTNTSDSFVDCITCTIPDWTSGTYDRDWVGVGAPNSTLAGYFKTVYAQLSGEDVVGLPRDNGGGAALHRWASGWLQDFGGGSELPGALMLADGTTTPYVVYGGVWTQYLTVDHGAAGCHRYPTSALAPYAGLGSDTYLRQNFQIGSIVWDATTGMVVQDVCS